MYPILRNPRGSLQRKCDSDKHALAVGIIYHFYVEEGAAINGDGTESSPWNNINNAITTEMVSLCSGTCTKVYVHVSGSIDHYIGDAVLYDFMDNLIFMPWNQERVTVDPGANCLYFSYIQRAVYASGIIFRQFDFTQTVQPYESGFHLSQIRCLPRCTLENCTVSLYASSSGLPETISTISIIAIDEPGNVINSTINIFMTDSSNSVGLNCYACALTTAIDSTFTVNISGGYSVNVEVVNMNGPTGADPYMARCNVTVNINSGSIIGFLVWCGENTVIEYSNISGTIDGWGDVGGVSMQGQMYSSEVSLSLSSATDSATVVGVQGVGDLLLVGCSIIAQAVVSVLTDTGSINNHARGIIEYAASSTTTTLLVDSCTINASATHSVTWPEPAIVANSTMYETSCAIWAQGSLIAVSVIDSELSSGACVYQHYDWNTGIVTNGTECTSETYYPASCLLGA